MVEQSFKSTVTHPVCGSCSESSHDSAAPRVPSTLLLSSGERWAPVWTAAWEAPHAYEKINKTVKNDPTEFRKHFKQG